MGVQLDELVNREFLKVFDSYDEGSAYLEGAPVSSRYGVVSRQETVQRWQHQAALDIGRVVSQALLAAHPQGAVTTCCGHVAYEHCICMLDTVFVKTMQQHHSWCWIRGRLFW